LVGVFAKARLLHPQQLEDEAVHTLDSDAGATERQAPQCNHAGALPSASNNASSEAISGEVIDGNISRTYVSKDADDRF
jgi:hypothetical protein